MCLCVRRGVGGVTCMTPTYFIRRFNSNRERLKLGMDEATCTIILCDRLRKKFLLSKCWLRFDAASRPAALLSVKMLLCTCTLLRFVLKTYDIADIACR